VAELALDDDQRHAFASQLDGMRMPELVRREAPTDTSHDGGAAHLRSGGGTGRVPASCRSVDDAEQRPDRKIDPQLEPRAQFLPRPRIHADLAAASALAAADEQRAAAVIEIGFGEAERLLDAEPRALEDHDQGAGLDQTLGARGAAGRL
jgi:hypothetical protein